MKQWRGAAMEGQELQGRRKEEGAAKLWPSMYLHGRRCGRAVQLGNAGQGKRRRGNFFKPHRRVSIMLQDEPFRPLVEDIYQAIPWMPN